MGRLGTGRLPSLSSRRRGVERRHRGGGTIDGGGEYWWALCDRSPESYPDGLADRLADFRTTNDKRDDVSDVTLRPPLLQVSHAQNVTVTGVTLRNSPFWNTHVVYSEDVTINDVRIENPADAPNGDGIDVDSSRRVRVSDCSIAAGDDAICLKSGKDAEEREIGRPTAAVTVTNCTIESGHGGVVIGSEMSGDVRDVAVSNCTFRGTDRGIRIKTQRGRGGVVEDLRSDTLLMRDVACPLVVNGHYFDAIDDQPQSVNEGTPHVRDVHVHDLTARNAETAGFLVGLPERTFGPITLSDVHIDATRPLTASEVEPAMTDGYEQGHELACHSLAHVSLSNVAIETPTGPSHSFEDVGRVTIDGLRTAVEAPDPVLDLSDVNEAYVSGCVAPAEETTFATVITEDHTRLSFAGNYGDLRDAVTVEAPTDSVEWC